MRCGTRRSRSSAARGDPGSLVRYSSCLVRTACRESESSRLFPPRLESNTHRPELLGPARRRVSRFQLIANWLLVAVGMANLIAVRSHHPPPHGYRRALVSLPTQGITFGSRAKSLRSPTRAGSKLSSLPAPAPAPAPATEEQRVVTHTFIREKQAPDPAPAPPEVVIHHPSLPVQAPAAIISAPAPATTLPRAIPATDLPSMSTLPAPIRYTPSPLTLPVPHQEPEPETEEHLEFDRSPGLVASLRAAQLEAEIKAKSRSTKKPLYLGSKAWASSLDSLPSYYESPAPTSSSHQQQPKYSYL